MHLSMFSIYKSQPLRIKHYCQCFQFINGGVDRGVRGTGREGAGSGEGEGSGERGGGKRGGEGSGERGGGKRGKRGGGKRGERGRKAGTEVGKRGLDTPLSTPT